jgi:hypothetical protein
MNIDVTKEVTEAQISVEMNKNTQGFDEDYPLGFMSPAGFIRLQVAELSVNRTPRYAYPMEGCNYSISLFGKEYNEGNTRGTDHRDWIPINTKRELILALQIQKSEREKMGRLGNKKVPNAVKILNDFIPKEAFASFHPNIREKIISAMNQIAFDAIELNK